MDNQLCKVMQERLRQAQYSFNLTLVMTTACTVIGMTGLGLLLAGRISEGAIATTGGMAPLVPCLRFARDANDRLDELFQELNDDD